ncbi:hypothetical protein ACOSQ3_024880 [Xanthoceras sorbifolium]
MVFLVGLRLGLGWSCSAGFTVFWCCIGLSFFFFETMFWFEFDLMELEEIAKLCELLSLFYYDGPVLNISGDAHAEGIKNMGHCLVGKVLSRRRINREAFKGTIELIWGIIGAVDIEVLAEGVFVFHFQRLEDR